MSKHPTAEQLRAVDRFALKHGRYWKRELRLAWYTGRDAEEPEGHLLRQVRNNFGPPWLEKYRPSQTIATAS